MFTSPSLPVFIVAGENIDRCIIQTVVLCGALCSVLKLSVLNNVLVKCSVNPGTSVTTDLDYLVLLVQLGTHCTQLYFIVTRKVVEGLDQLTC